VKDLALPYLHSNVFRPWTVHLISTEQNSPGYCPWAFSNLKKGQLHLVSPCEAVCIIGFGFGFETERVQHYVLRPK